MYNKQKYQSFEICLEKKARAIKSVSTSSELLILKAIKYVNPNI